ncbi:MAG TPA: hypothetical protein VM513_15970 [Kofleriaceae bacterium]|nr:hypothetical protein [Kofleriaceae bacterium]
MSLCLLAGCLPKLDIDDAVVVEGKHITLYADPAIPVCEASMTAADRFVEDTAAMLGIDPPRIDYYLFDGETGCGLGQYAFASCAVNGAVFANHWIHFHELVHAVDDSHPPALFVEGLAEALSLASDDARTPAVPRDAAVVAVDSSSFRAGDPWERYSVAGDFVRYVVERFGPQRYREFARSVSSLADPITIRRQFQAILGAGLDQVIADWRAADPAASRMIVPVDLAACGAPTEPVAPDRWAGDGREFDGCTSGLTANQTTYTQPATRFGFEVTTPGLYELRVDGSGDGEHGRVWSCESSSSSREYTVSSARMTRAAIVPLAAGRHAIDTVAPDSPWSVTRIGAIGSTCDSAPTVTAPQRDAWELAITAPPWTWVRIEHDGLHALRGTGSATGRVCTGPCGALRCQPLVSTLPLARHEGEPMLVQLGADDGGFATATLSTAD